MKKSIKIIAVIMLLAILATCFIGCAPEENNVDDSKVVSTRGKHDHFFVTPTSSSLVSGGTAHQTIVIRAGAKKREVFAAEEFQYFVERSTGVKLPILRDSELVYDESAKYISIGETSLFKNAGLTMPDEKTYGVSGYMIKSVDDDTFIVGSSYRDNYAGCVYGVYGLLDAIINLEVYSEETITFDKHDYINMPIFDVEEIPDFDERRFHITNTAPVASMRLGITDPGEDSYYQLTGHSELWILTTSIEYVYHEDWLGGTGNVICHSSYLTGSHEEYAKNLIKLLETYPESNWVNIGVPDETTPCVCSRCKSEMNKYKTNAAGLNVIYLNKILNIVEPHMSEKYPERDIQYSMYAYQGTFASPTTYDKETDSYIPHSQEVIPHKDLEIWFCPIGMNTIAPITAEENKASYDSYRGWSSISDNVTYYGYPYWSRSSGDLYPNAQSFVENVRYWATTNMRYYYEEGHDYSDLFSDMIIYVESKMLWDVNLDYKTLAKDFMNKSYGVASDDIWAMYEFYMSWYAHNETPRGMWSVPVGSIMKADLFTKDMLNVCLGFIDDAITKINALKTTDYTTYLDLLPKIQRLQLMVRNTYMYVHKNTLSTTEMKVWIDEMREYYPTLYKNTLLKAPDSSDLLAWWDKLVG